MTFVLSNVTLLMSVMVLMSNIKPVISDVLLGSPAGGDDRKLFLLTLYRMMCRKIDLYNLVLPQCMYLYFT